MAKNEFWLWTWPKWHKTYSCVWLHISAPGHRNFFKFCRNTLKGVLRVLTKFKENRSGQFWAISDSICGKNEFWLWTWPKWHKTYSCVWLHISAPGHRNFFKFCRNTLKGVLRVLTKFKENRSGQFWAISDSICGKNEFWLWTWPKWPHP